MKYSFESNEQWARRVVAEHDAAKAERKREFYESLALAAAFLCVIAACVFAYAAGVTWQMFQ